MNRLISGRWMIVLFVVGAILFSSGHQSGAMEGTPAATAKINATAQEPVSTVSVVFGPGPFHLPDPTVGLMQLSSYKATLTLSFDGTNVGKPQRWSKTYVMLVTKEPAARQLTIDRAGDAANRVFMAERDGTSYKRQGNGLCMATVLNKNNALATELEPGGFLNPVIGANEAGSETVNGVVAQHYTFDERALGPIGDVKSTGELWIASDGDYVVRYLLTTRGKADYFGEATEGTITWDYELTNVNQTISIELPTDCPAGVVDAPLLPNAADIVSQPGLLTYRTDTSVANTVAFYQKQLVDLGWTPGTTLTGTDTIARLEFTKSGKHILIIIIVAGENTWVNIALDFGTPGPVTPTKVATRTLAPTKTPAPTKTRKP